MTNLEILSLIQRVSGIIALGLITIQIYLGANRKNIALHKINGILAYTFVFIHPVLLIIKNYLIYLRLDPFYVFVDVCIFCNGIYEHYLNLGRVAFYLITAAVLAVKLRELFPWFKKNWRKLHILNYIAFYFVSFHAFNLGSDATSLWFIIYFGICQLLVLYSLYIRLRR